MGIQFVAGTSETERLSGPEVKCGAEPRRLLVQPGGQRLRALDILGSAFRVLGNLLLQLPCAPHGFPYRSAGEQRGGRLLYLARTPVLLRLAHNLRVGDADQRVTLLEVTAKPRQRETGHERCQPERDVRNLHCHRRHVDPVDAALEDQAAQEVDIPGLAYAGQVVAAQLVELIPNARQAGNLR